MAQLEMMEFKGSKRKFHSSLKIDMTPMVDLGFLLITFFIFTTSMTEKRAMKLMMPAEIGEPLPLKEGNVLTVILDKGNKIFAYEGKFEDAVIKNKLINTTYNESDGIGKLIRDKQNLLQQTNRKEGKDALVFLIRPTPQATYKNIIDALDETTINNVKKFMLLEASESEKSQLKKMDQ